MRDDNFFADKRLVHTSKPGQVIVPTMGKTFHPQLREQMPQNSMLFPVSVPTVERLWTRPARRRA